MKNPVQVATLLAACGDDEVEKAKLIKKLKDIGVWSDEPPKQDRKGLLWCGHQPSTVRKAADGTEFCSLCTEVTRRDNDERN